MKGKVLIHGSYKKTNMNGYEIIVKSCWKGNLDSTVYMETISDEDLRKEIFQMLYICFDALKRGFETGCKRVLGVDGYYHLRSSHLGVLLTSMGKGPNGCIYPVACAIVKTENKRSWKWFLQFLKYDLGTHDQRSWTFISDRYIKG